MKTYRLYIALFTLATLFSCSSDDNDEGDNIVKAPTTIEEFNLLTVANNTFDVALLPTLTWQNAVTSDGSEVNYTLYLDTNTDPSTAIASNISSNTVRISDKLKLYTDYHWRVEASSGSVTKVSSTFGFTTRNLNTDNPALTTNAAFPEKRGHTSLFFDDKFWIIAGISNSNRTNDIWNSTDGVNWTLVNANADFSARALHTSLVFDGKMWVIGGSALDSNNDSLLKNDIWYSADGINWVEASDKARFDGRFSHTSVVFDNKMWVIGGFSSSNTYMNDVWSSYDGIDWNSISMNADFSARNSHEAFVLDDKMYIVGGSDGDRLNDVWSTTNGSNWTEEIETAPFTPRISHKSTFFDNKIWLVGGIDANGTYLNDVWYTSNGQNWIQSTDNASYTGRIGHTAVANENGILIIAGTVGAITNPQNDVWVLD